MRIEAINGYKVNGFCKLLLFKTRNWLYLDFPNDGHSGRIYRFVSSDSSS